jgi:hypothetical protein
MASDSNVRQLLPCYPVRRDPAPGNPDLNSQIKAQESHSYDIHEVSGK